MTMTLKDRNWWCQEAMMNQGSCWIVQDWRRNQFWFLNRADFWLVDSMSLTKQTWCTKYWAKGPKVLTTEFTSA